MYDLGVDSIGCVVCDYVGCFCLFFVGWLRGWFGWWVGVGWSLVFGCIFELGWSVRYVCGRFVDFEFVFFCLV